MTAETRRKSVWVLNGPNLNLLGTREPELYGSVTLPEIEEALVEQGARAGVEVVCYQSNQEGALVDRVHQARGVADGLVLNPGAYGHTSIALLDALLAVGLPAIEVHVTNVYRREPFRRRMRTAGGCLGVITGLGPQGYQLALGALISRLLGTRLIPAGDEAGGPAGPWRTHP